MRPAEANNLSRNLRRQEEIIHFYQTLGRNSAESCLSGLPNSFAGGFGNEPTCGLDATDLFNKSGILIGVLERV